MRLTRALLPGTPSTPTPPTSGSSSSGIGGGVGAPDPQVPHIKISGKEYSLTMAGKVTDSNGRHLSVVTVDTEGFQKVAATAENGSSVTVQIPVVEGACLYRAVLSGGILSAAAKKEMNVTITAEQYSISFPAKVFGAGIAEDAVLNLTFGTANGVTLRSRH